MRLGASLFCFSNYYTTVVILRRPKGVEGSQLYPNHPTHPPSTPHASSPFTLSNEHAIPIAVEAILRIHSMPVRRDNVFFAR